MLTNYRMSYPYFGIYKFKLMIRYSLREVYPERTFFNRIADIKEYLHNNWVLGDDFKISSGSDLFIRDQSIIDNLLKIYSDDISVMYRPAAGYENLEGKSSRQKNFLWYDKFAYKIKLMNIDRYTTNDYNDVIYWCKENLKGDFKSTAGGTTLSLYLMNLPDTMAAKLAFCDKVISTEIADSDEVIKKLRERLHQAKHEFYEYLDGEGLDEY
jgi:hypothetical protein